MKTILTSLLLFLSCAVFAQKKTVDIPIRINYQNTDLQLGKIYYNEQIQDSIRFDKIRFYLSNIRLFQSEKELENKGKKYQLIDFSATEEPTLKIKFKSKKSPTHIAFDLGVDSLTNASGAHGGDLDPINGMYWAWQSGYIFFKMEGYTPKSTSRKQQFIYHIGGYQSPYNALQNVSLDFKENANIVLNLDNIIQQINFSETSTIMSPSKESVNFAKLIANSFKVQ